MGHIFKEFDELIDYYKELIFGKDAIEEYYDVWPWFTLNRLSRVQRGHRCPTDKRLENYINGMAKRTSWHLENCRYCFYRTIYIAAMKGVEELEVIREKEMRFMEDYKQAVHQN